METHGVLVLSREPPEANDEGRPKGLAIGKHKLGIITTLDVAGELSRRARQEKRAAYGDRRLCGYFLVPVVRLCGVFHAEWKTGTELPAENTYNEAFRSTTCGSAIRSTSVAPNVSVTASSPRRGRKCHRDQRNDGREEERLLRRRAAIVKGAKKR
jgi:hypothetical protein